MIVRVLFTSFLLSPLLYGLVPTEISLQDEEGTQTFVIACDQLQCLPEHGTSHLVAGLDSTTPAEIVTLAVTRERSSKNRFNLVLYPQGKTQAPKNKRTLSRRIHAEMTGETTAEQIAKLAGASAFKVPHYSPSTLILTFPNPGDSLDKLPAVRALPGVTSARPLLSRLRTRRLTPNDPRFAWSASNTSYQWHLKNTGQNGSITDLDVNITNVWDSYLGTGVTVSVVDDGVQVAHEDLAANINSAIDHDWNDNTPNDPTPPLALQSDGSYFSHGTSVAGVIAGRGDNNLGITGAAPRASIVGLKILTDSVSPAEEAEALAWRTDIIDISNNSWGAPDDGVTLFTADPLVISAFQNSVATGRGGKGTIYVWSAGNGRAQNDYANYDGFVNQPETIGVGSINFQGTQSYYSESGANVLISAPSDNNNGDPGITTTTITTEGTYTDSFGGTSSAAPLVSGVIALILEANPNLGWRDVQEILIRSARKVDSSNSEWTDNGAGFHFHHGYGAGMIDAEAAIDLAKTWTNLGTRQSREVNAPSINQAIPDGSPTGITHTFSVTGDQLRVEHVTLTIDIDHPYRGDIIMTLTSPDGTISELLKEHDDGNQDYENYPLLSVRHWGESAIGTWTLKVIDNISQDSGTLNSASLQIHGAEPVLGYSDWVTTSFPTADQSNPVIIGELADPDNDGRSNLLEYAFGGDPTSPEAPLPHEPAIIETANGKSFRFTSDTAKSDITYLLETSTTLTGSWQTVPTNLVSSTGTLEVRERLINTSATKRFYRLEISK